MLDGRDRRTGFSRRRQYSVFAGYVLAVAGAVAGAVLLVLSSAFNPPAFAALRMSVASVTAPVSTALNATIAAVAGIPDAIGSHFHVRAENQALRADMARHRDLLVRARTIVHDNRRLRALLQIRDRDASSVATARLVSSTASSGRRFALLNAGRLHGVLPAMPVIGPDGLVGRVLETGPAVSRVLLLTDTESLVPVRRTRDGLPAIAAGRGDGALDIRSVTTNVRFDVGDVFVTTGTGGIYAPGTPVARVQAAGVDNALGRAFAHPDGLDYAIVQRPFLPLPAPRP
ncbi:MAG: rod shape-determining protein MreC [Sphingomonas bacterium]|uniref:rod shape-determining protein MreC n=1 Tax=Sphingomonas bacterium TaxID=1895847 RepID=UPI00261A3043|nr:rod shape-determining protein MreC [Sphingomonas bacterium]MDB5696018.1 rod shape-determining protein MreC [Sphingomonas bacterium]